MCVCCSSTCQRLTSQVLVHHIWSVFHKQTEHGGAAGSSLQPEHHRGLSSARLMVKTGQAERLRPQHHPVVTAETNTLYFDHHFSLKKVHVVVLWMKL